MDDNKEGDCPLVNDRGEYIGLERREREAFPSRAPGDWHLTPVFAYTVVVAVISITGFVYGMRGDLAVQASRVDRNADALQAEMVERKAAVAAVGAQLSRSEDSQRRAVERLADKMDGVRDLIIKAMQQREVGQ
tara:strand:- start:26412 stop:26813 length:402 start_codon:yes stop_codon:yes gene_type:complete